jgi:osmotically-inducible protein OsmY
MTDDDALRESVLAELAWEPAVDATHIGVIARNGIVTLTGHVPSYAQRLVAEQAAKRVRGVRGLAMELEVRLAGEKKHADHEIAERAVRMLNWDEAVPRDRITVEVDHGVVTLSGTVDWNYQRIEAEQDVRKLGGVRDVINTIVVKPRVEPAAVRERIVAAFKRNAELDASGVTVMAEGGKVVLSGKVRSWAERELAHRAAWSAPGVASVEDHIVVRHG